VGPGAVESLFEWRLKKRRPCGGSNTGIHLRRVALYPLSYRGANDRILPFRADGIQRKKREGMMVKKIRKMFGVGILICLIFLTACSKGGGSSTSTPGTGEEHSLPSAQAGYPSGAETSTPQAGYPQP
jgi:hypothetical protein